MQSLNYQILNSVSELKKLNISSPLVVDTETTGLDTHRKSTRIIGIGLCWSPTECCYIDLSKLEGEELLMELKLFEEIILNNPAYEKWGQNLKFDLRMFSASGINYCSTTHDSNVLNYCLWVIDRVLVMDQLLLLAMV
jgi:DNA polymerase-1